MSSQANSKMSSQTNAVAPTTYPTPSTAGCNGNCARSDNDPSICETCSKGARDVKPVKIVLRKPFRSELKAKSRTPKIVLRKPLQPKPRPRPSGPKPIKIVMRKPFQSEPETKPRTPRIVLRKPFQSELETKPSAPKVTKIVLHKPFQTEPETKPRTPKIKLIVRKPSAPKTIITYCDGPFGRLHSIRDVTNNICIFHHERDFNRDISMRFIHEKIAMLRDEVTGETIYSNGLLD
ncbi:hypothetical protein F4821DRAFT_277073 [Hypoxylon rubiginosum]|uniref:Uncharacterized protein n=1 Tax=Hypoxylon rubiginosum TaxID=110542 RepID=A0ACC0D783_9PEZI|nr:hypothetical protein F4821DRAFT_277073 [Hypoxylon rubiginosum]